MVDPSVLWLCVRLWGGWHGNKCVTDFVRPSVSRLTSSGTLLRARAGRTLFRTPARGYHRIYKNAVVMPRRFHMALLVGKIKPCQESRIYIPEVERGRCALRARVIARLRSAHFAPRQHARIASATVRVAAAWSSTNKALPKDKEASSRPSRRARGSTRTSSSVVRRARRSRRERRQDGRADPPVA